MNSKFQKNGTLFKWHLFYIDMEWIFMPFCLGFYNKYSIQMCSSYLRIIIMQCGNKVLQMKLRERERRNKQMFCQLKLDTNILLLDRIRDCWIIIIWNLSKSIFAWGSEAKSRPTSNAIHFSTLICYTF